MLYSNSKGDPLRIPLELEHTYTRGILMRGSTLLHSVTLSHTMVPLTSPLHLGFVSVGGAEDVYGWLKMQVGVENEHIILL